MCKVSKALAAIGAINWGLVGAFDLNLVNVLLGGIPVLETIVYILVGIAGVMCLIGLFKCCGSSCSQ